MSTILPSVVSNSRVMLDRVSRYCLGQLLSTNNWISSLRVRCYVVQFIVAKKYFIVIVRVSFDWGGGEGGDTCVVYFEYLSV